MSLWFFIICFSFFFLCCFSSKRPNFIFFLTDDQDIEFNSVLYQEALKENIISKGIGFDNFYVASPICCISRTTLLTGRYYHNVRNPPDQYDVNSCNDINQGAWISNATTLFHLLHDKGNYKTGVFGKLNNGDLQYWCNRVPLNDSYVNGYDVIYSACDDQYYQTEWFAKYENGTYENITLQLSPNMYYTSLVGNKSLDFLHDLMENDPNNDNPFIIYVGVHSPHFPADPAPWYGNEYPNEKAPRTPNFNMQCKDHHAMVANNPELDATAIEFIDEHWRDRLRTLLSVDDIITEYNKWLNYYNLMDNTYIIYTSDHGYHLGQWRIPCSKQQMYQTDIHIPFYITGPNLKLDLIGKNVSILAGNIDITPTILDLANIDIPDIMDGKSFKSYIIDNQTEEDHDHNNKYHDVDVPWRDIFLSAYVSPFSLYYNHCLIWYPFSNGSTFPGHDVMPLSYPVNDHSDLYYVDDSMSNNWHAIRILNTTHNWVYGEYVNQTFTYQDWENPNFVEFYDLDNDPYQIYNLYFNTSEDTLNELHNMLLTISNCTGSTCP